MCGLVGFIEHSRQSAGDLALLMAGAIEHRGPDDVGVWTDPSTGFALAHRRLSILELSDAGHQPMQSPSGRYVIAFNGEIYNHLALRSQVPEQAWRGHSDTESLLACFEHWGIEQSLPKVTGMFAMAVVDTERKMLWLIRDRLGEKPLYYGWQGDAFMFSSEIKALQRHPAWAAQVDRSALDSYTRLSYIPVPMSAFDGIHKLPPGSWINIDLANPPRQTASPYSYWSPLRTPLAEKTSPKASKDWAQELDRHLRQAIKGQLLADVPVGAFLSGGVDSSLIVALMREVSGERSRTFTIGFDDKRLDEAPFARAVAKHLDTDHTEIYISADDVINCISTIVDIYDEPLADSSQIATYLVCKLASKHVKVCLSGDGGDELFGGYNRYRWGENVWRRISKLPQLGRESLAGLATVLPARHIDRLAGTFKPSLRGQAIGDKSHKLATLLRSRNMDELYEKLISHHRDDKPIVINAPRATTWDKKESLLFKSESFAEKAMLRDLLGYLSDDLLAKLDRAAMAVSLETRAPFLDHHLVEFALSVPQNLKIRHGQTKYLMREVLYQYVPRQLIERPKQGFSVPIDAWLRGRLRDWAEESLDFPGMRADGILDVATVKIRWKEHLSGERNWQHWIWNIIMFQLWKKRWA